MKNIFFLSLLTLSVFLFLGCINGNEKSLTMIDGPDEISNTSNENDNETINYSYKSSDFIEKFKKISAECDKLFGAQVFQCEAEKGFKEIGDNFCDIYVELATEKCQKNKVDNYVCASQLNYTYYLCLNYLAVHKKDQSVCLKFKDTNQQNSCKSYFEMQMNLINAKTVSSIKDCENMDLLSKPICITNVAVNTGDISICNKATSTFDESSCISSVALKKSDPLLCNQIKTDILKPGCILNIAIKSKNIQLCNDLEKYENLSLDTYVNTCQFEVAAALKDASKCPEHPPYCVQVVNKDYLSCGSDLECIFTVATFNNDIDGCKTIPADAKSIYTRDRCITFIATNLKDSSLCIYAENQRWFCENRVKLFSNIEKVSKFI